MATIVGGIATSHTPTIGFALDAKKQQDPVWAPIFAGYEPVRQWLAAKHPDVLFFVYNDHITSFFFDHYSHFALGVGAKYWVADEGGGARKLPPIAGHPALASNGERFFVAWGAGEGGSLSSLHGVVLDETGAVLVPEFEVSAPEELRAPPRSLRTAPISLLSGPLTRTEIRGRSSGRV